MKQAREADAALKLQREAEQRREREVTFGIVLIFLIC
jgi:hypothetical protein